MTDVDPEAWLRAVPMVELHIWVPCRGNVAGHWRKDKAVKDVEFLDELVRQAISRHIGTHAVHEWYGRWRLAAITPMRSTQTYRYFDSREAAEMVAMHERPEL